MAEGAPFEIEWIDVGRGCGPRASLEAPTLVRADPEGGASESADAAARDEPSPVWGRRHRALMRRRLAWDRHHLDAARRDALRFLPVLFQASFRAPGLSDEAPGIRDAPRPDGWGLLARRFRLPPPLRASRARPAIEAILARPLGAGLSVLLVLCDDLEAPLRARIDRRMQLAASILGRRTSVSVEAIEAGELAGRADLVLGFGLEGALVAGDLGGAAASALLETPIVPQALLSYLRGCADPFASLALLLLLEREATPPPLATLGDLPEGLPLRHLAAPRSTALVYAARCSGRSAHLLDLYASVAREPKARADATALLEALLGIPRGPGEIARLEDDVQGFVERARALGVAALRALRRSPLRGEPEVRAWVAFEAGGFDLPRAFHEALRPVLLQAPWRVVPGERGFEVREAGGACLLATQSEPLARVRGVALATAMAERPLDPFGGPRVWQRVAQALAAERPPRWIYLLEPSGAAGASMAETHGVVLGSVPGRRPSARVLDRSELPIHVLRHGTDGGVLFLPFRREALRAVATFSRWVDVLRDARAHDLPAAFVLGSEEVLVAARGVPVRRFRRATFLKRPRRLLAGADLLGIDERAIRGDRDRPAHLVLAHLTLERDPAWVRALLQGADGWIFEERLPLIEVPAWLEESQALLRGLAEPAVLTFTIDAALEERLARLRRRGGRHTRVEIEVTGHTPMGLHLHVGGQIFGAGASGGWRAAAETILAQVPIGHQPELRVTRLDVTRSVDLPAGLAALHARSITLRRLGHFLRRLG